MLQSLKIQTSTNKIPPIDNQSQLNDNQLYEFDQQVSIIKLRHSVIAKPCLNYVDCSESPDKLSEMMKRCGFPQNMQKLNISACSVMNLGKILKVTKNGYCNLGSRHKDITHQESQQDKRQGYQLGRVREKLGYAFKPCINFANLKQLILDNNIIEHIPSELISLMKMLRKLSFNSNLVSILPYFSQNSHLNQIYARLNPIKQIQIGSQQIYIEYVDFDWLEYIDISAAQRIRCSRVGQELDGSRDQYQFTQIYNRVTQQLRRVNSNNAPNCNEYRHVINFKSFLGTFLKIRNMGRQLLLSFVSFNLRRAILDQFDLFLEYCYQQFDSQGVNFNTLRYKGNLLLQYALDEQYEYAIGLFTQRKDNLINQKQTVLESMKLACRFSHHNLFKFLFTIVNEDYQKQKYIKKTSKSQQSHPQDYLLKTLFHTQDKRQIQKLTLNGPKDNKQKQPQIFTLPQSTKFYRMLIQLLLHFNLGKKSHKILGLMIQLLKTRYINDHKDENSLMYIQNVGVAQMSVKVLGCQIQCSQFSVQPQPCQQDRKFSSVVIVVQAPGQHQLKGLTSDQIQSFVKSIYYVKQSPKFTQYFRVKQEGQFQKYKNLLEIAASIKNNQLLLMLLWKLDFSVFNRNILGKIARTGKILMTSKKILYSKQISQLERRLKKKRQIQNITNGKQISQKQPYIKQERNKKETESQQNSIYEIQSYIYQKYTTKYQRSMRTKPNSLNSINNHQTMSPLTMKSQKLRVYGQSPLKTMQGSKQKISVLMAKQDYKPAYLDRHGHIVDTRGAVQQMDRHRVRHLAVLQRIGQDPFGLCLQERSERVNGQYQLLQEIEWLGYAKDILESRRVSNQPQTRQKAFIRTDNQKQTSHSILQTISQSVFKCHCVQPQDEQQSHYDIEDQLNSYQPLASNSLRNRSYV